jgi:hypothetical protein
MSCRGISTFSSGMAFHIKLKEPPALSVVSHK